MCMEMTVAGAAQIAGVAPRTVQRALKSGHLGMARLIGRQVSTDDLAVQAWVRTTFRGRKWSPRIRDAAISMLSNERDVSISPSERSRLRSALREMSAHQIASSSWPGTWARYRMLGQVDVSRIGPSVMDLTELGIIPGASWMHFAQVDSLDQFESTQPVIADPGGDLVVIERQRDDRWARQLIDVYVLGDARESAAAARNIEELARAL